MINPLVCDKPLLDQSPDLVEQEFPDLFLACAMAKRGTENDLCCDIDLADIFIGRIHNAEVNESLDKPI